MIAPLLAGGVALLLSLFGTGFMARRMREHRLSQPILVKDELNVAVPDHLHKSGTPTMGGLAVLFAAFVGYLVSHLRQGVVFSRQTALMWLVVAVMAAIGFWDDSLKVRSGHNRGVLWRHKGYITLGAALAGAVALVALTDIDTRLSLTRAETPGWQLGAVAWVLWAGAMVFATTNAVNVTDGLDGLAAGSALLGFVAFTAIAYLGFRNPTIYPSLVDPYDLAVFAAAFAGACVGFLWWNGAPADIFMGDVGALGLGSALALLALATNTQLLLPLLCGLNVIEIGSVALQMIVFRASGRTRRLFRLSPIHHHFEIGGWPETKVIIRFWLISGMSVAGALAIYVADFTQQAATP
ncbi:MAG: phospho-N-acetylmuramoyl-pentapeptide-transferase [Acidimicrobiales bacterium]|nr:phospho-N-acetylmuramoyl-pentapeptide-transferase [Acidimicrobiales bacterium]MCB9395762.1 phospho-N-acetylmuramoyl-pentapeptide-transferase [Acidimicrobiaceae bacterium]